MMMEAFNFVLFDERENCSMSQQEATINDSGYIVYKVFGASSIHCSGMEEADAGVV